MEWVIFHTRFTTYRPWHHRMPRDWVGWAYSDIRGRIRFNRSRLYHTNPVHTPAATVAPAATAQGLIRGHPHRLHGCCSADANGCCRRPLAAAGDRRWPTAVAAAAAAAAAGCWHWLTATAAADCGWLTPITTAAATAAGCRCWLTAGTAAVGCCRWLLASAGDCRWPAAAGCWYWLTATAAADCCWPAPITTAAATAAGCRCWLTAGTAADGCCR